jgi:hypothetical protein
MPLLETGIPLLVGGIIRNVLGWLENAVEDGKISSYEWKQGLATVIRVVVLGLTASFAGLDPVSSAGGAVGLDFIITKLQRK